jgi:hypothetical protein
MDEMLSPGSSVSFKMTDAPKAITFHDRPNTAKDISVPPAGKTKEGAFPVVIDAMMKALNPGA